MSLKYEVEQEKYTDLKVWLLVGALVFGVYSVFQRATRIHEGGIPGTAEHTGLREQTLEVSRRLNEIAGFPSIESQMVNGQGNDSGATSSLDLLQSASENANRGSYQKMAKQLLQLGSISVQALNLIEAELYAEEALTIGKKIGSKPLMAQSYQQLGHINIVRRNLARRSAHAYDSLLIVRNRIAMGQFSDTQSTLGMIIDDNMALGRYGAAASAWETLALFYDKQYDDYLADQARMEAARLFASSGSINRARSLAESISTRGYDVQNATDLKAEIESLALTHEQDKHRTAAARDLKSLYYHYLERGDDKKAWEFRLKAAQVLLKNNNQAMFYRQPDVLAVLYKSNQSMDLAKKYLQQAESLFGEAGMLESVEKTRSMQSLVF